MFYEFRSRPVGIAPDLMRAAKVIIKDRWSDYGQEFSSTKANFGYFKATLAADKARAENLTIIA